MKVSVTSGNYKIIDSGTVIAFDEDEDITFHIDAGMGFRFTLKIIFKSDETGKQTIGKNVTGNDIKFECYNFANVGTGTSNAIELATYQGEKIYFKFWSFLDGDMPGKKKTRKINYAFYLGK